jgi:2-polyprenyl-3-methyl-5-hydroxy-6-metoxy-1,4-benzoquinol methylase
LTPNDKSIPANTPLAPLCILCGHDAKSNFLYPGILRCPSCGFVFADTQLSAAELQKLYQRTYFFGNEYLNYLEDKPAIQKNFSARMRTLMKFSFSGNLFEIGCAYGFFLDLAQRHWKVQGCDISEPACDEARRTGLDVTCGDFLDLKLKDEHFDVVAMWDTIEHLARPDLYVQKASSLLKPGGILCATTGDIGSMMAKMRKQRWRLIHPPTHLYYFDRRSIQRLMEQNGLEIIHFEHCGYSRSVQQILYSLLVLNHETGMRRKIYDLLKPLFNFSLYLNLYDIMFVIARKK